MLGIIAFVLMFIGICGAAVWYLGVSLISSLLLSSALNNALWATLICTAILAVGGIFAFQMERRDGESAELLIFLQELSFVLLGWLSVLLTVVAIWDTMQLFFPKHLGANVIANLSVLGISIAATFAAWLVCMQPKVREIPVPLEGLHPDFNGYKIAVISDLHVGPWFRRNFVEQVVEKTNAAAPHLVAIVGDLADGLPSHLKHDLEPLRKFSAPDGVAYVTGNHEYYWNVNAWLETASAMGFRVLMNQANIIKRGEGELAIVGIPDKQAKDFQPADTPNLSLALSTVPAGVRTKILLDHNPNQARLAAALGVSLQISGHTHGGQFFPWTILIHLFTRFSAGAYDVSNMKLFVSRGTGAWGPPLRLGSNPEIPVLVLEQSQK